MSLNNTPEIRRIYREFHIETVTTSYTMAGGDKRKTVKALLISNFKLKKTLNMP